jgi:hypothetical protein
VNTWDELKFKPEDFGSLKYHRLGYHNPNFDMPEWVRETIVLQANRILKEKLEKAQKVFTAKVLIDQLLNDSRWYPEPQIDEIHGINWSTHTARLVCIEEINSSASEKKK